MGIKIILSLVREEVTQQKSICEQQNIGNVIILTAFCTFLNSIVWMVGWNEGLVADFIKLVSENGHLTLRVIFKTWLVTTYVWILKFYECVVINISINCFTRVIQKQVYLIFTISLTKRCQKKTRLKQCVFLLQINELKMKTENKLSDKHLIY